MCFQNCKYEASSGECNKSNFPPGWVCPHNRRECKGCGETFHYLDLNIDSKLCSLCEKDIEKGGIE